MSAYLMICLYSESFNPAIASISEIFENYELWDQGKGWQSLLNNVELILRPYLYFNFILKWLKILPIPQLSLRFPKLIAEINDFDYLHYLVKLGDDFSYSSA